MTKNAQKKAKIMDGRELIPDPEELEALNQNILDDIIEKHQMYLKGQHGGARANIKYKNLSHLSFRARDLSQADFTGSAMIECDMSHSNFSGATFFACDLRNSDLRDSNLSRTDFRGSYLAGANLTDADLTEADFREGKIMTRGEQGELTDRKRSGGVGAKTILTGTKLKNTKMDGVQAINADFSDADLSGVTINDANITQANFFGANLSYSDFTGSVMTNANLKSAIVSGCILATIEDHGVEMNGVITESDMGSRLENLGKTLPELLEEHTLWVATSGRYGRQLDLSGYDLRNVLDLKQFPLTAIRALETNFMNQDLRGAELQSANFDRAIFTDCNLYGADLRGSTFKYSQMARIDLTEAKLSPLSFGKQGGSQHIKRVDISGSNLRYATIKYADLRDCVLMGVDLTNAIIMGSDLRRADFTGAILKGTIFKDCNIDEAKLDLGAIN